MSVHIRSLDHPSCVLAHYIPRAGLIFCQACDLATSSPHFLQPLFLISVFCTYDLLNFSTTECGLVCHVKCAPNLPRTCGLPSQFVEHFSETLQELKDDENDKPNVQSSTRLGGRREGWLRVPRYDIAIRFSVHPCFFLFNNNNHHGRHHYISLMFSTHANSYFEVQVIFMLT